MSNCCNTPVNKTKKISKLECPKCHESCKSVSLATVLQHLLFPFNLDINNDDNYYCLNIECAISYFSISGNLFSTSQIRDKVELQQGWLCYCFDISKKQYQHALDNGPAIKIKEFVIAQTKAHQCSCETRNPSGQCCLADFKKMEKTTNENS